MKQRFLLAYLITVTMLFAIFHVWAFAHDVSGPFVVP